MELVLPREAFDRGDLRVYDLVEGGEARACGLAVHEDGARAAGAFAAAVLAAGETELVAQHGEQRPLGLRGHRVGLAVDAQLECLGHSGKDFLRSYLIKSVSL
jgi:hypothetical protein